MQTFAAIYTALASPDKARRDRRATRVTPRHDRLGQGYAPNPDHPGAPASAGADLQWGVRPRGAHVGAPARGAPGRLPHAPAIGAGRARARGPAARIARRWLRGARVHPG